MYTETGACSIQGFRTLFKEAIEGANQNCINKQILKSFQRYPEVPKRYGKFFTKIFMGVWLTG